MKKKRIGKKGMKSKIIVGLVAIIILTVAIFAYVHFSSSTTASPSSTPSPTPSATPLPVIYPNATLSHRANQFTVADGKYRTNNRNKRHREWRP